MIVPVPSEIPPAERLGRVHFVGIGGAGLSGIARIMLARGVPVSGCDARDSEALTALRRLGARCWTGHDAEHVADADTVVVSTAVGDDNPDVLAARRRGMRLLPRSAALESVMQGRRVVAVAGTHGKTTTTALLTVALRHCGADPSFAVGGDLVAVGVNALDGSGDLFVAEADESDGAFLVYSPSLAVVTNVAADHLDNYGTEQAYAAAFEGFLDRIRPGGTLVACVDDPGARRLATTAREGTVQVVTVGESPDADVRAEAVAAVGDGSTFAVRDHGERLGEVSLRIPGRHYALDALVALAAGLRLGFGFGCLVAGLASFTGTRRRMELKGTVGGIRVYDSYAHHPREIAADLEAARTLAGDGRVVVAFQPHLVSRTRVFAAGMGQALGAADAVVVLDVYAAREQPDPAVTGELVASGVPLPPDRVRYEPVSARVAQRLAQEARPGDVVLTLGAGDVTSIGPQLLDLLSTSGQDR